MTYVKLAVLSLLRHWGRTLAIILAVAVAVAVMLSIDAMLAGMRRSFFTDTLGDSGHLQIHARGWEDRVEPYSLDYPIEDYETLVARLSSDPRVTAAEPLAAFGALAVRDDRRLPAVVHGVVADTAFFSGVREGMIGRMPRPSESDGGPVEASIGRAAATLLGVSRGERCILLVEDTAGTPFYAEALVVGIYEGPSREFETTHFFLSLADARQLAYLPDAVTEIRVALEEPRLAEELRADYEPLFSRTGVAAATWREIHGSFTVMVDLMDVFVLFMNLLVAVVASTVIANAVLMSFFRRIGEFGSLRAIGLRRSGQSGLILLEGLVYGLLGGAMGLAVGIPLTLLLESRGINMGEVMQTMDLSPTVYFDLTGSGVIRSLAFGFVITLASGAYVAFVAGRMGVVSMFAGKR